MTAPYQPKPTIVDRVLARLFPTAAYNGLLDPQEQQGLQRQGLLQLGTNLLQAGGRSANQRGTLANIGASIQGVNLPEMAAQALQFQQIRQQRATQQAVGDVVARHPAKPNETPTDTYTRIAGMVSELAGQPGTEDLIGKLSNVLAQLRPQTATRRAQYRVYTRLDEHNMPQMYERNLDTGEETSLGRPVPPRPTTASGTAGSLQQKAQAGARTAIESINDAERLSANNPEADVSTLGASLARGAKASGGVLGLLGGLAEPIAQKSMTPDQQQFQADIQRMAHSMVGLLPGSRQSVVLFNSLVNAYTPQPWESAQARSAKRAARLRAREWLTAVDQGRAIPPLPDELVAAGFTQADITPPGTPSPTEPPHHPRNPFRP